jgi:two-component system sensor histidine kinase RegB
LKRIGEPYLTRRRGMDQTHRERRGLGLGIFIARTLLERSDAEVAFSNRTFPEHGAVVRIAWPRASFETSQTTSDA